jgi:hypothetical protein
LFLPDNIHNKEKDQPVSISLQKLKEMKFVESLAQDLLSSISVS